MCNKNQIQLIRNHLSKAEQELVKKEMELYTHENQISDADHLIRYSLEQKVRSLTDELIRNIKINSFLSLNL